MHRSELLLVRAPEGKGWVWGRLQAEETERVRVEESPGKRAWEARRASTATVGKRATNEGAARRARSTKEESWETRASVGKRAMRAGAGARAAGARAVEGVVRVVWVVTARVAEATVAERGLVERRVAQLESESPVENR